MEDESPSELDADAESGLRRQGRRLFLASALLLATCLLWILAVVLNFVGPIGRLDAGILSGAAMLLDLPGALLLTAVYTGLASRVSGRERWIRRGIAWTFVIWAGLSAYWRFGLPLVGSSNLQDLVSGLLGGNPAGLGHVRTSPYVLEEMFGVWIAASLVFVLAHVLVALDYRRADEEDWVKGLPVYAWLLGSVVSAAGTIAVVVALLPIVWGGTLGDAFTAGAVLKLLVAPNLMVSGYVASLQLGRTVASMGQPTPTA